VAFFDHMRLWYMKNHVSGEAATNDNIINISEHFWDEIREHPIPADLNVVRALVNAPGCLDLYLWLVWRCFKLKRDAQIPLFGACGLAQQLGTDDYLRARDLRRTILRWLHVIRVFWTDCPASVGNDGKITPTAARAAHSLCRGSLRVAVFGMYLTTYVFYAILIRSTDSVGRRLSCRLRS